ncbi:hypothetical protein Pcinc_010706 [Petrolisthes cinctipes]|uniref:Uncharacterized protein n=1 Tax=Petrolisthes cinctipes TaxID=88211 RepID=A0AAE1KV57_PETCI|nr:hypothetical protein Pcinc_010706 [Petrolisthes cinctipes]
MIWSGAGAWAVFSLKTVSRASLGSPFSSALIAHTLSRLPQTLPETASEGLQGVGYSSWRSPTRMHTKHCIDSDFASCSTPWPLAQHRATVSHS